MDWEEEPKVYAVKHKDEATRAASRSRGRFYSSVRSGSI